MPLWCLWRNITSSVGDVTIITAIALHVALWLFSASSFHELPKQDDKELKCQKSATKTGICLRGHEYPRRLSVYLPDFLWRRSKIPDRGSDNRNTCEASRRIKIGPHWSCSGHHCALSECSWWLHKTIHCGNLEAYYFLGLQPEVPCIFIWANSAIWIDPTFTSSSSRQDVDCGLWIVDCGLCVSYYYPTLLLSTTCCGGKPLQSTRIWNVLDFCKSFVLVNATVPTNNSYLINISSTTIGHMAKHVNQDGPADLKCKILQTKVTHE